MWNFSIKVSNKGENIISTKVSTQEGRQVPGEEFCFLTDWLSMVHIQKYNYVYTDPPPQNSSKVT